MLVFDNWLYVEVAAGLTSCKNSRIVRLRAKSLLPLLILAAIPLRADDGAASVAAGGVVVMNREPRVTMAKEVLQISASKVIADYDFRNDSNEDIRTEVAFPIPDYDHDLARERVEPSQLGFDDFQLWINATPTRYLVEARAFLKDIEYTKLLHSMHIDIPTFGHATLDGNSLDIQTLAPAQRKQLEAAGLVNQDGGEPLWQVRKKYYWQQTFPKHKTVHIRHEYSPILGGSNSIAYGMRASPDPESAEELKSFCIEGQLHSILQSVLESEDKNASYSYVDFILTTANTWKTPIEDFTLIVKRTHRKDSLGDYVSFCWDGPVTRIDTDHFSAHATNLVPAKELRVGFFSVEHSRF